jgi:hypothetical protein
MKPALANFKSLLAANCVSLADIRYVGQGKRLVAIGFDAFNKSGGITVEPQYRRGYFVSFNSNTPDPDIFKVHWWQHYAHKKFGFQPTLTLPVNQMKMDILKFFGIVDFAFLESNSGVKLKPGSKFTDTEGSKYSILSVNKAKLTITFRSIENNGLNFWNGTHTINLANPNITALIYSAA